MRTKFIYLERERDTEKERRKERKKEMRWNREREERTYNGVVCLSDNTRPGFSFLFQ